MTFDDLWKFITNRRPGVVQERNELEHVFNLIQGCESYLEIGTAEGDSLYVLAHALRKNPLIKSIDYGEAHTEQAFQQVKNLLYSESGIRVFRKVGNSHDAKSIIDVIRQGEDGLEFFEVVLIDAGHSYEDVIADASAYGWMATKYILFHDICLPEVNRAFEWYCKQRPDCVAYKRINSETFGYGIMEIKGG